MLTHKTLHRSHQSRESGLVSLMVVSIIVVLLTLISIGFSRLMNRELRQALDRQLSAQAYYAAESGINDARAYLTKYGKNAVSVPNSCKPPPAPDDPTGTPDPQFIQNLSKVFNSNDDNIKYSCVSINTRPKELVYSLKAGDSVIFKLDASTVGTRRLYFGWQNVQYTGIPQFFSGTFGELPKENSLTPNSTGLLRVSIFPINAGGSCPATIDPNDKLSCDSRTYFLYPSTPGSARDFKNYGVPADNGDFIAGNCSSTATTPTNNPSAAAKRYCNSSIQGGPTSSMYVQISAVYAPLSVAIQDTDSPGAGPPLARNVPGIEAVIDATGTGNDVLRRLQTRVVLADSYYYPESALSSMAGVCKRLRLPIISSGVYGPAVQEDTDASCEIP